MKNLILGAAVCAAALTACTTAPKQAEITAGIDYTNLDTTVTPGNDFFKFATGNWLAKHPQPAEYPSWGAFGMLADENVKQLQELIMEMANKQNTPGSVEQKVADLYTLAMDSTRRNSEGAAPLKAYLEKVNACQTREDLIKLMNDERDNIFFSIFVGADEQNSSQNIVCLYQGGLSLGDKDYYLAEDPQTSMVRDAFKQHMVNMYKLVGFSEEEATKKMNTIWAIETELAKTSLSKVELRDPVANYHKMNMAELKEATGNFDWDTYFKQYSYDATSEVNIGQIAPIKKGCELLMTTPLEDLKTVYEWRCIAGLSGYLSDDFVKENFEFNKILTGVQEMQPRWKRAVNVVDGTLGNAVGQIYVAKYFPAEAKERMINLVHNLQTALGERIKAQTWMTDSTKAVALDKLNAFYIKIGYPDKWDDLSKLSIDPKLSFAENMINAGHFFFDLDKEKHYNKPVDKDEWFMSPQTVNAYYNPTTNEICFPAGILQPPFFDMNADDACNYGAIGVVIGHEMTHGFDDQGRQYDKNGNMKVWWCDADVENFKVPAEQLACHFDTLNVLPDLKSNGHLCLGENLADHGGLNVAFEAFKIATANNPLATDNGFTPEQRFFLSYANVWAGTSSDEMRRYLTRMDVHSANFLRVNGTLPHINAWYEAFNIQPGDSLYIAKENRVNIW